MSFHGGVLAALSTRGTRKGSMCAIALASLGVLMVSTPDVALSQGAPSGAAPKTLAVVGAHADDEGPVAPILARYAREGVRVYLIIASDGIAGFGQQGHIPRPDVTVQGDELVRQRADEARCATQALGIQPPILLGFPDGKLGDYVGDRALIYRVTQRIAEELGRLRPDAVVTWGPDGGTGHPDHRIVSNIVTQLQRAGAPGVPERVFYMNLPVESMRAMNPQRGEPPLTVPQAKYFTVRIPFAPEDLRVMERSMACHRSQFTPEVVQRVLPAMVRAWDGAIPLIPAFATAPGTDLFQ
jgi:LmbE family N-acetylglucosaminyl deacetylase